MLTRKQIYFLNSQGGRTSRDTIEENGIHYYTIFDGSTGQYYRMKVPEDEYIVLTVREKKYILVNVVKLRKAVMEN